MNQMDKHINQMLTSGLSTLKYLLRKYEESSGGILKESGVERTVRKMDILVLSFGEQEDADNFTKYKKDNWLSKVAVNVTYTKDTLYGEIKDLEFLKGYLDTEDGKFSEDTFEALRNGLENLLELYSLIFNNWESYAPLLENRVIVEDVPEETMEGINHVQEFDYEELIKNGGTPNYNEESGDNEDALPVEEEPKTRVERRRNRRSR